MTRHIALLRGINVGGHHKLPMKRLVAWFEDAGCEDVSTYIQSGNVVFSASAALARSLPRIVTERAADELGFETPVVLRSAREWKALAAANPYLGQADEKELSVGFLGSRPTKRQLERLDPMRSQPDAFTVLGREIYLRFPNGIARTKLTNAYFDAQLETVVTVRNWRTVKSLLERI